jgi:hypothetical protein
MSDLTDRMRTCAAYILSRKGEWSDELLTEDAVALLLEASNALEKIPEPLGTPMEVIPPAVKAVQDMWQAPRPEASLPPIDRTPRAVWTTNAADLPPVPTGGKPSYRPPRVCPACDSRANKRVFRDGHKVMLGCPVCAHAWEYRP